MNNLKKGISSAAAAIIIATISISLVGTTYFYSRGIIETSTAEIFEVIDVFGNKIIIKNLGTQTITELLILIDGQEVGYSMDDIPASKFGSVNIDTIGIEPGTHDLTIASKSMAQTFKWNFVYVESGETSSTTTTVETSTTTTTTIFTEGQSIELSMETQQGTAEIDKPVKWSSKIEVNNPSDVDVEDYIVNILIPEDAKNITIEDPVENAITKGEKSVKISLAGKVSKSYFVDFETPAPYKEEEIDTIGAWRKLIRVKSDALVHYKNVRVDSEIYENKTILRLFLIENNTRKDVTFDPSYNVSFIDSDINGLIDTVKWLVPELSEKVFEVTSGLYPPRYYDNSTDAKYAGYPVKFSLRWTDDGLSGYIFSIDQGDENFVNDSWIPWKDENNNWASQNLGPIDDGVNLGDSRYNINISDIPVNYSGNTTKYAVRLDVTTAKGLDNGDGINCYHSNDGLTDWDSIGSCLYPSCLSNSPPYTSWINSTTSNLLNQIQHDGETKEWIHCNMIGIGGGEDLVANLYVYFDYIAPIEAWSNITKIVNETAGAKIRWIIYANDTDKNWNYTELPFSFNTIPYYGWLNITLINPNSSHNESNPLKVPQKDTFNVNATIKCEGPGETCGPILASVRYNESDSNMLMLSTNDGDEPMWTLPKIEEDQYIYKDWNFYVGNEMDRPVGLAYNGTHFWIVNYSSTYPRINRYNADGTFDGWSKDINADVVIPTGIYVNETTIGVVDSGGKVIFYDINTGNNLGDFSDEFTTTPTSLVFNKTYVWVLHSVSGGGDKVYRYNLDGTLDSGKPDGGYFSVLVGLDDLFTPQGLEFNGTNWFVVDNYRDAIHAYDINGNYLNWYINVSGDARGLTYYEKEDNFYTVDWTDLYVRRYEKNVSGTGNPATLDDLDVGDFIQVNFTVNATTLGSYKIDVNASSEYFQVQHNSSNHSVIKIVKAEIISSLSHPDPEIYTDTSPFRWTQNTTQIVTATVTCENGDCGNVVGTIRYNDSSLYPNASINTTKDAKPFYITLHEPRSTDSACKPQANETESNTGFCRIPTWSYNPNKLCIDFIYSNPRLDGDRINGEGGYKFYPDKKVGIFDIVFISGKINEQCGDNNYDQMADVNNDCVINLTDIDLASSNFNGDYIYNLTDVHVNFDTGDIEYLDDYNCTWIPENAKNFTVYNSSNNLVGAMVLFHTLNSSISCGQMNDGDSCQLKWIVNVTGNVSVLYKIGVQFNSTKLENKHTDNASIEIIDSGRLIVNLSYPTPFTINDVTQNTTFNINASVECIDEYCGLVKATVRYNNSGIEPDYSISTVKGSKPFYTLIQDRPITYNYTGCCYQNIEYAYDDGYNDSSTYARLLPSAEGESIRVNYTYSLGGSTSAILYVRSAYDTGYAPGIIQIYNFTSETWFDWIVPNLVTSTINNTLLSPSTGLINSTGHTILSVYAEYPNGGSQEYVALFDTHVYYLEDENSQICHLNQDEICYLNWIVNATGNLSNIYSIDVNFASAVKMNDTNNSMVRIIETYGPRYWNPSTNSTNVGEAVEFRLRWTDNFWLSGYIFSLDNCTGEFKNQTNTEVNSIWVPMIGTGNWSNETYVINSTEACEVRWKFYANDTFNNWNESSIYSFYAISPNLWLNTTLIEPSPILCNETIPCEKDRNVVFVVNTTVECKGGYCGRINGTIRYNSSQSGPNTLMPSGSGEPFYVFSENLQSCNGILNDGDTCQFNWTVVPTGTKNTTWQIDTNFSSDTYLINDTNNSIIKIVKFATGELNVNLIKPEPTSCNENIPCVWGKNKVNTVNATVECIADDCGNVFGTVRYNESEFSMLPINTTQGKIPLYLILPSNIRARTYYQYGSERLPDNPVYAYDNSQTTYAYFFAQKGIGAGTDIEEAVYQWKIDYVINNANFYYIWRVDINLGGADAEGKASIFFYDWGGSKYDLIRSITNDENNALRSLNLNSTYISSTGYVRVRFQAYAQKIIQNAETIIELYDIYINPISSPNLISCGSLSLEQTCTMNWTVVPTGNIGDTFKIDVNVSSDMDMENTTENKGIIIITDSEPPTYSDNSTNSTIAGQAVEFSLNWTDNVGLSGYILSLDNCTGSFQNVTGLESMTGQQDWSNHSVVVSWNVGCMIKWKYYAVDTNGNWAESQNFSFKTTNQAPTQPTINDPVEGQWFYEETPDPYTIYCSGSTDPDDDDITYSLHWAECELGCYWNEICLNDPDGYCDWDWGSISEGNKTIRCKAYDGKIEGPSVAKVWIIKDTTDSTCILNISNSQILYSPYRLNGTYYDTYNVSNVTYQYYNTSDTEWDDIGTNSTADFTWVWDVNGGLEDTTSLIMRVICNDTAGNSVVNATSGIIVDTINQNPLIWNLWVRDDDDEIITKTGTGVNVHFTVNVSDPDPAWNISYLEGNLTLPNGTSVYENFTLSSTGNYTHIWTYTIPITTDPSPPNATINATVYDLGNLWNNTNRSDLIIMETFSLVLTNDPVNFSAVTPGQKVEALPNRGWPLLAQLDGNVEIKLSQKAESDLYGLLNPYEKIGIRNITWNTKTSDESFSELVSNYYKIINETAGPGYDQPIYYKLYVPNVGKQDYGSFLTIKGDKPTTPSCNSCSYPCTIKCNDPQSHWNEISVGDSYYFTYTLDSPTTVFITMTPDPTGDGGPDYDLYTSWTADTCYGFMSDCGDPMGGDVEETCSSSSLPAGTYYFEVYHWGDSGNGFYLEFDCIA